jgi:hypothetical protein
MAKKANNKNKNSNGTKVVFIKSKK